MLDRGASTMLFGLAANTDNLTIGVAYGLKHRWIGWQQNLVIAPPPLCSPFSPSLSGDRSAKCCRRECLIFLAGCCC